MSISLPILYQDEFLVVVSKPPGISVHRSPQSPDRTTVLQILRDQIGQYVYPVHRLDRGTSGILVFACSSEIAALLCEGFREGVVKKKYLAVCRGWLPEAKVIDHAYIPEGRKEALEAVTEVSPRARVELPYAVDRYPSSRYCLVEARPQTGRTHQIRRHLRHVSHPIIGDSKYGKGKHNLFFREEMGVSRLLLSAVEIEFCHPRSGELMQIRDVLDEELCALFKRFDWLDAVSAYLPQHE